MISYAQFLASAQPEDIRVMNLFAMGQKIEFDNAAQADDMFARVGRLDSAGFVLRMSRTYENRAGVVWQRFEAFIDPVASTYLSTAAAERVQLSRLPLPPI